MKAVSPGFEARLASDVTTLARLWRMSTRGGALSHYMTDHDEPIIYGGVTYLPTKAFEGSAVANQIGGSNTNFEARVFCDDVITRADMERGVYDGASVELDLIFYDHPEDGVLTYMAGLVADISLPVPQVAILSCNGYTSKAKHILTEQYTPLCRAEFCDARCSLLIEEYQQSFIVTEESTFLSFKSDLAGYVNDYFDLGSIEWTLGRNAGTAVEVYRTIANGDVQMLIRPSYRVEVGDQGTISRGCDKRVTTCRDVYDNLLNYRGEPYVPGGDAMSDPEHSIPNVDAGDIT